MIHDHSRLLLFMVYQYDSYYTFVFGIPIGTGIPTNIPQVCIFVMAFLFHSHSVATPFGCHFGKFTVVHMPNRRCEIS